jgi:hypothetical protein
MKRLALVSLTAALALTWAATPAQADPSDFGLESVSAGISTTQAGAHPDFEVGFTLSTDPASPADPTGLHEPYARVRDIVVGLPPGLIGNPHAVAECTAAQFATALSGGGCPQDSQIGIAVTHVYTFGFALTEPIFNMAPPEEGIARLGLYAATSPVIVDVEVRSEGDYGLDSVIAGANATERVVGAETTIWAVPAADVHDTERLSVEEAFNGANKSPPRPSGLPEELPFLANPTSCGRPQEVRVETDSYAEPGRFSVETAPLPALSGCGKLNFDPSFEATPSTREAASPSGLDAKLHIPQDETVKTLATSQLRNAIVTLPKGMTIASGAAEGLEACSATRVGLGTRNPSNCPAASKIATTEFDVPQLSRTIKGAVYQRTPEPGRLFRIWLVSDELGVNVKIPGEIEVDRATGQVSSVFIDNPQVPLEELRLHFKPGPRGVLATPSACGTYRTAFELAPWSGRPAAKGDTPMTIDRGCDTGGFSPKLQAGSTNPVAGAFSPFVFQLTNDSGAQNIAGVEATLPPGALAKLAGVGLCPEGAAPTGSCPASSQVGVATAAVGPGPSPLWIPQPGKDPTAVYLAGPYKGAPYSLLVKTPAQAGPFDLGTVVVRAALRIDPVTSQVTVVSDPLPQILEGVPVTYRTIHVAVDRPEFAITPTNCSAMAVSAKLTSAQGASANPQSRYQVGSCSDLGFKPKLALKLKGGTKRGDNPALRATYIPRAGDANLKDLVVRLPRSAFLDQGHIRTICTRVQFAAEACPAGSVYGQIKATTPLLSEPLQGPVYLRSSSHKLPDLVFALKGPVEIEVAVRIDSIRGAIRANLDSAPDAPLTKVVLDMQGAQKGLIQNSRDLCAGPARANVSLEGQNGKAAQLRPLMGNGCGKGRR